MGSIVQKGLRLCSGQTNVKRYLEPLTKLIQEKKVDTTFLITHRSTDLAEGPDLYQTFKIKKDGCVKVVFHSRVMTLREPNFTSGVITYEQGDSNG
jgi:threonine dehydrogenase-like Zn-dependent dehydrogenase